MAIGVVLVAFFGYLLLHYLQTFVTETIMQTLSLAEITYDKILTAEGPAILMRLLDGTDFRIVMTWQRSGIISIMIFSLMFITLTFPLKGLLWCKVAWLGLGNVVGLAWNVVRLSLMFVAIYYFGTPAFGVVDFITGPTLDFIWVVPVWSVGLSALASSRRRKEMKG